MQCQELHILLEARYYIDTAARGWLTTRKNLSNLLLSFDLIGGIRQRRSLAQARHRCVALPLFVLVQVWVSHIPRITGTKSSSSALPLQTYSEPEHPSLTSLQTRPGSSKLPNRLHPRSVRAAKSTRTPNELAHKFVFAQIRMNRTEFESLLLLSAN